MQVGSFFLAALDFDSPFSSSFTSSTASSSSFRSSPFVSLNFSHRLLRSFPLYFTVLLHVISPSRRRVEEAPVLSGSTSDPGLGVALVGSSLCGRWGRFDDGRERIPSPRRSYLGRQTVDYTSAFKNSLKSDAAACWRSRSAQVMCMRVATSNTTILQVLILPNIHVFGVWVEARKAEEMAHRHRETIQNSTQTGPQARDKTHNLAYEATV